jgi:hypothetical protein
MAVSLSTGVRNHLLGGGSLRNALQGGIVKVFSGTVPADANAAQTGTLLASFTDLTQPWTPEVRSFGTVTLTGSSGQVTQVSVNGVNLLTNAVPFNNTITQTALDLVTEINNTLTTPNYLAVASDNVVAIMAMPGTGVGPNGYAVVATVAGLAASVAAFAGGVASANGIRFSYAAAGFLSKISTQLLRAVAVASGTAAYWRIYTDGQDTGAVDTVGAYRRVQGVVGDTLSLPNPALVANAVVGILTFQVSAP